MAHEVEIEESESLTYPSPYSLDDFQDIVLGYMHTKELYNSEDPIEKKKAKYQMKLLMKEYFRAVGTVSLKNRSHLPILQINYTNPQNVKEMIVTFIQNSRLKEFSYFKPNDNFVIKIVVENSAGDLVRSLFAELGGFEEGVIWRWIS